MSARLLAVLSTERSGSTLLSLMMAGHPRLLVPPELHLLRYASLAALREGYPPAMESVAWLQRHLGIDEVEDADPLALYRKWLGTMRSEDWLVDKTPAYGRSPDVLATLEALEPTYVHLVRHPLGVALSWIRVRDRRRQEALQASRGPGRLRQKLLEGRDRIKAVSQRDLQDRVGYWTEVHRTIDTHLQQVPAERRVRLHYEDLVRDPERELRTLCDVLSLPWEPAMLHPRDNAPTALAWGVGDENVLEKKRIDAGAADRWRERIHSERSLGSDTRALMERLGVR